MRHRGPASFLAHFGDYRPSVEPRIGIGDTFAVTIWEAGAGGLFSAPPVADRFSTGSKSATIPDQVVGRDGAITVPYAGRIPVDIVARRERDFLDWLCLHMPHAVTPDWLIGLGAGGAALAFAGYAATRLQPAFFWLATLGVVIHWFGDSLDGSLARYRRIDRPRTAIFSIIPSMRWATWRS